MVSISNPLDRGFGKADSPGIRAIVYQSGSMSRLARRIDTTDILVHTGYNLKLPDDLQPDVLFSGREWRGFLDSSAPPPLF
jgi:hypothetical protein